MQKQSSSTLGGLGGHEGGFYLVISNKDKRSRVIGWKWWSLRIKYKACIVLLQRRRTSFPEGLQRIARQLRGAWLWVQQWEEDKRIEDIFKWAIITLAINYSAECYCNMIISQPLHRRTPRCWSLKVYSRHLFTFSKEEESVSVLEGMHLVMSVLWQGEERSAVSPFIV